MKIADIADEVDERRAHQPGHALPEPLRVGAREPLVAAPVHRAAGDEEQRHDLQAPGDERPRVARGQRVAGRGDAVGPQHDEHEEVAEHHDEQRPRAHDVEREVARARLRRRRHGRQRREHPHGTLSSRRPLAVPRVAHQPGAPTARETTRHPGDRRADLLSSAPPSGAVRAARRHISNRWLRVGECGTRVTRNQTLHEEDTMEHGSIEREIHVDASPEIVFEVITSPEHIREWWNGAETDVPPRPDPSPRSPGGVPLPSRTSSASPWSRPMRRACSPSGGSTATPPRRARRTRCSSPSSSLRRARARWCASPRRASARRAGRSRCSRPPTPTTSTAGTSSSQPARLRPACRTAYPRATRRDGTAEGATRDPPGTAGCPMRALIAPQGRSRALPVRGRAVRPWPSGGSRRSRRGTPRWSATGASGPMSSARSLVILPLLDGLDADALEGLGERGDLGRAVELAAVGQAPGPGEDRGDRVGRGRLALLVLAVVARDRAVRGLGLDGLAVRASSAPRSSGRASRSPARRCRTARRRRSSCRPRRSRPPTSGPRRPCRRSGGARR